MPAIETFDWFKKQVWDQVDESTRALLDDQRGYLLEIRNENERLRFIEDVMKSVRSALKKK